MYLLVCCLCAFPRRYAIQVFRFDLIPDLMDSDHERLRVCCATVQHLYLVLSVILCQREVLAFVKERS